MLKVLQHVDVVTALVMILVRTIGLHKRKHCSLPSIARTGVIAVRPCFMSESHKLIVCAGSVSSQTGPL